MKLQKKQSSKTSDNVLLLILDGVGYTERGADKGNAIASANLPTLKELWTNYPNVLLKAHGKAVGMPSDEDMGNSEVGHNVIGCGRVFDQGAKLVSNSIASKEMYKGKTWSELIANCKTNSSTLHFLGLFSDGNVHSHIDHLKAMIGQAKIDGLSKVRIHILLDGRDVPETSALDYLIPFEEFIAKMRDLSFDIQIASGGGRMNITMDRYDADWTMVERGWNIHVLGIGRKFKSAQEAIETYRKENPKLIDQYMDGFVIAENDISVGKIQDGDSVVFFNFRGDRAIEISKTFTEEKFDKFDRGNKPCVYYAGMMQYDGDLKLPKNFLVTPPVIDKTLGEYMANTGIRQYALSETQKFGHVTYFWNGNRSGCFNEKLETYQEILSDVIPFDQAPNMKAKEITDTLIEQIKTKQYNFMRVNFPNGDMVGHTGNFDATVQSLEFLDSCIKRIVDVCKETNTVLLITADHGNSDEMYQLDKKGNVQRSDMNQPVAKTSHTLNPVNLAMFDPLNRWKLTDRDQTSALANIAATILDIMGYEIPEGYELSLLVEV